MHRDARYLENNTSIEGDLCIIGAGIAGISIALDWINQKKKVVLLEGGGFEFDIEIQKLIKGKTTGQKYYNLAATRLQAFGGTSGYWGGACSPFDSIDFEKREWVPHSGWPINLANLEPYFSHCSEIFDLQSDNFNPDFWLEADESRKSLLLNNELVYDKIWQFSPPTRLGSKYKDEIVNASNIELYTYARVTEIHVGDNKTTVERVKIKNFSGKEVTVNCTHFILACGALQNARLLLASRNSYINGIGNEHDNVGRYFMEHLEIDSAKMMLKAPHSMGFYLRENNKTTVRAELGITNYGQEKYGILNGTASIKATIAGRNHENFMEEFNQIDPNDRSSKKNIIERIQKKLKKVSVRMEKNIENIYQMYTRLEQSPNPNSRIFLDSELDDLGVPKIILNWELSPLEKISIQKMYQIFGWSLGIDDLGRIKLKEFIYADEASFWPEFLIPGNHHMGTTRMSEDPKNGVVDKNCKVHGIKNLYIAGSSCFATSGAANPTFTLTALSLRLSAHLKNVIV